MGDFLNSDQIVIYAAYGLVGLATFVVSYLLMKEQESRAAEENLDEAKDRSSNSLLVKVSRPLFSQYVVPMVRGKEFWANARNSAKRKLISGGLKEEFTPDEFVSFKLFLIVFFPIVGGFLQTFGFIDASWWMILLSGVLGWFYPDLWAKGLIQKRQKEIRRSLPFIVDLLALSTEAGLDFVGAIGKVVEKSVPSPLVDELEQVLKEIKVGSSRAEALREMAARVDMTEVNSFIAVLVSADSMGAPVGKTLRQQSEQIRNNRFVLAEKEGAKAAAKLMIPIVMVVLPAVLLMIVGPFALTLFIN